MGFPILVRLHLYIESGPRIIPNPKTCTIQQNMYSRLVPVAQLVRVLTTNPKVSSPHGVRYFLSQNFKCYSRTSICQLKINAVARVWFTFLISTSSTTIYMNLQASKNFVIKLVTIVAGHQLGNIPQRTGSQFNIKTPSYQYRKSHCGDYKNPLHLDVVDRYLRRMGDKTIPDEAPPSLESFYPPWVAGIDLPQSRCCGFFVSFTNKHK